MGEEPLYGQAPVVDLRRLLDHLQQVLPIKLFPITGGGRFLMGEVPLYPHGHHACAPTKVVSEQDLQGYLAHKKTPRPRTLQ